MNLGDPSASPFAPASRDSPGIRWPPSLIFLAGIGVGALVNHFVPATCGPTELRDSLAVLLFLAGLILLLTATQLFKTTNNDLRTDRPAAMLLTTGPYARSRNPMYLAFALVYASAALLGDNVWLLLLLPVCVLVLQATVITAEEKYLQRCFGPAYEDYSTNVRRWL